MRLRPSHSLTTRLLSALAILAVVISVPTASYGQDETVTPTSLSWENSESRANVYEELRAEAEPALRHYALVRKVIRAVQPSVVHLEAKKSGGNGGGASIEETGAGIIFAHDGRHFVMTNLHVINNARNANIRIQLSDGRFFSPAKVWKDPGSDLAVMQVEGSGLVPCLIGDSDETAIGDFVLAIGSPFGLNHSASYGIVSARGRRDLQLGDQGVKYQDFIQTDAAINPGNSGGPLINLLGEVVGINTAIASNSGSNEGIGFAIPINMAIKIAVDLIETGEVARAFLGVSLDATYSPHIARQLGLNTVYGARVASITRDSPAASAKLAPGDVILKYQNLVIENDSHLVHAVSMTPIGSNVPLIVYRDGKTQAIQVTVTDRKRFQP